MFEIEFNRIFNHRHFIVSDNDNDTRFKCTATETNKYNRYLKLIEEPVPSLEFVLESIAYNSSTNARCWNLEPLTYTCYDEHMRQRLPQSICSKIRTYLNSKIEFKQRVERILQDYHILLDINDNAVNVNDYPDIWFGIGYFETFPISYFDIPISEDEIKDIAKAVNDRFVIVKSDNGVTVYHLTHEHDVVKREYNVLNASVVVDIAAFIVVSGDETKYNELMSKKKNMSSDTMNRLTRFVEA